VIEDFEKKVFASPGGARCKLKGIKVMEVGREEGLVDCLVIHFHGLPFLLYTICCWGTGGFMADGGTELVSVLLFIITDGHVQIQGLLSLMARPCSLLFWPLVTLVHSCK